MPHLVLRLPQQRLSVLSRAVLHDGVTRTAASRIPKMRMGKMCVHGMNDLGIKARVWNKG
jgi:hypothetical protein